MAEVRLAPFAGGLAEGSAAFTEGVAPNRELSRRECPRRECPRRESPRRESPRRESPRHESLRRGSARGGVVVEGLIVIAFTCVFLGSGIGLYRACIAKLHAVRDTRAATWTLAVRGCSGNGMATELSRDILTLTEGGSEQSEIPVLSWMTSDDVFQQRSQTAKGPANREYVMTSKAIVTCNETPSRAGADWAADTMRSLIGTAFAP
jgi:hypothetical protein